MLLFVDLFDVEVMCVVVVDVWFDVVVYFVVCVYVV